MVQEMSLSMKEVDQNTGEDLNPREAPLAEDAILSNEDRRRDCAVDESGA